MQSCKRLPMPICKRQRSAHSGLILIREGTASLLVAASPLLSSGGAQCTMDLGSVKLRLLSR